MAIQTVRGTLRAERKRTTSPAPAAESVTKTTTTQPSIEDKLVSAKRLSSRNIDNENGKFKIITYNNGYVKVENRTTGKVEYYQTTSGKGVFAGDISIPELGILSYEQQRAAQKTTIQETKPSVGDILKYEQAGGYGTGSAIEGTSLRYSTTPTVEYTPLPTMGERLQGLAAQSGRQKLEQFDPSKATVPSEYLPKTGQTVMPNEKETLEDIESKTGITPSRLKDIREQETKTVIESGSYNEMRKYAISQLTEDEKKQLKNVSTEELVSTVKNAAIDAGYVAAGYLGSKVVSPVFNRISRKGLAGIGIGFGADILEAGAVIYTAEKGIQAMTNKNTKKILDRLETERANGEVVTGQQALKNIRTQALRMTLDEVKKKEYMNLTTKGFVEALPLYIFENYEYRKMYEDNVRMLLQGRGFSKSEIESIIKEAVRQQRALLSVEIGALMKAEARANVVGAQAIARAGKPGKGLASKAVYGLKTRLKGGAAEATQAATTIYQTRTDEPWLPYKADKEKTQSKIAQYTGYSPGRLAGTAGYAVLGAGAAGAFGAAEEFTIGAGGRIGGVFGRAAAGTKTGEQIATGAGYSLDLFESWGDKATRFLIGKTGGKPIRTFGVTRSISTGTATKEKTAGAQTATGEKTEVKVGEKISEEVPTTERVKIKTTAPEDVVRVDTGIKEEEVIKEKQKEEEEELVKVNEQLKQEEQVREFIITPRTGLPLFPIGGAQGGYVGGFKPKTAGGLVITNKVLDITQGFKRANPLRVLTEGGTASDVFAPNAGIIKAFKPRHPAIYGTSNFMRREYSGQFTPQKSFKFAPVDMFYKRTQQTANKAFGKLMTKKQKKKQLFGRSKVKGV